MTLGVKGQGPEAEAEAEAITIINKIMKIMAHLNFPKRRKPTQLKQIMEMLIKPGVSCIFGHHKE